MMKRFGLLVLMFALCFSQVSWADGENEALDAIYLKYKLSEVLWDRDEASYGDEVSVVAEQLSAFDRDRVLDWNQLSKKNKELLAEMNLKLGDYFSHQRDPKQKNDGSTLAHSAMSYPALSLENLGRAELFYTKYLEVLHRYLGVEDWENAHSVRAYYYRATVRTIQAEFYLDRFEELGGETLQEQRQTLRHLLQMFYLSHSDFQKVKLLKDLFGLKLSVNDELQSCQYRLQEALALLVQLIKQSK